MRASDVVGRTIVGVRQERVGTSWCGGKEMAHAWIVDGFELDNGKVLIVMAIETDYEPQVIAWVKK